MTDVTIMGGGIFGLSLAFVCLERGARVRVVEKKAVGAGSSGGLIGALAPHVPENWNVKKAFQLRSLLRIGDFWARVETVSGKPSGYERTGRLQPVKDAKALELARARAVSARTLWKQAAEWRVVRAETAGEWAPLSPTGWLIEDTLSARLHPRRALEALTTAIRALGGRIMRGENPPDNAGAVVWATGHEGLQMLADDLGRPMGNGVKGQAALLRPVHPLPGRLPQIFADAVHVVAHADGTVAVGSTSERQFDRPDSCDTQLDMVIARARAAVPALAEAEVIARWAGVRPRAISRAPLLGPWPGRPGHFIMNGGFKIGFALAPELAGILAGLVLEGRNDIPEDFAIDHLLAKQDG